MTARPFGYRSLVEIDRAIKALDREIAAGRRVFRHLFVTTNKGL